MSDEKRDWKAEADEAFRKTGDSLTAAWDASRETRMSALQKAKEAATQLGAAIDRGVSAAKENWAASDAAESTADQAAAEPAEDTTEEE